MNKVVDRKIFKFLLTNYYEDVTYCQNLFLCTMIDIQSPLPKIECQQNRPCHQAYYRLIITTKLTSDKKGPAMNRFF